MVAALLKPSDDERKLIDWLANYYRDEGQAVAVKIIVRRLTEWDEQHIRDMLNKFERFELVRISGHNRGLVEMLPALVTYHDWLKNPEPVDQVAQTQRWWYSTKWGLATFIALAALFVVGQLVAILADLKTLLGSPDDSPKVIETGRPDVPEKSARTSATPSGEIPPEPR